MVKSDGTFFNKYIVIILRFQFCMNLWLRSY